MRGISSESLRKLMPSPEQFNMSSGDQGGWRKCKSCDRKWKTEKILSDLCESQTTCWLANNYS